MRALWTLLARRRDYRLLLGAGLVSVAGDYALGVGLAYYVYRLTGSTLAAAVLVLTGLVPQVVLGSVAGVFADRWERRRTMVVVDLLLAAGLAPLVLVQSPERVWIVYAVMLWESCLEQFFLPAEQSVVPHLVGAEQLVTANALTGQTRDAARLVGAAVGGLLVAAGGITLLAAADAATFVGSALLIAAVRTRSRARRVGRVAFTRRTAQLAVDWVDGLRLALRRPALRAAFWFALATSAGEGIMATLMAPYVRDVLHGSGAVYGYIVSVQAVGGIAGGLLAAVVGHRFPPAKLWGFGALAFGAIDLVLFLYPVAYPELWPAFVCMIVVGVPGALVGAGAMTVYQRAAADAWRGRVFGALTAVEGCSMLVGTLAAGTLGGVLGIVPVLAIQGAGYVVGGALVITRLRAIHADATPEAAVVPDAA
ncbi:MAG TPA: MFS transporter [Streptosporangiales bacterium]